MTFPRSSIHLRRWSVSLVAAVLVLGLAVACGDDANGDSTGTPTVTETPSDTPPPDGEPTDAPTAEPTSEPTGEPTGEPTAEPTDEAGVPAAPSGVTIEGSIPDLNEPVPPGSGEAGRISVHWTDESDNEDGFRIYSDACDEGVTMLVEVPADEAMHGPLNPCRPARIGVAAYNAEGESEITWTE